MPDRSLRLLLVEDNPDDADLVVRQFVKAGYRVDSLRVEAKEAMVAALESGPWDAVISDVSMPRFSAEAALQVAAENGEDRPFLVVSGVVGEENAVALLKAGAHDFVLKSRLARLVPAFERERREAALRHARREAEQSLAAANQQLAAAVAARTRFLASASHDMRQPVQAMFCFVAALAGMVEDNPAAQAVLADLDQAVVSLKQLLDALLDVSRLDAGMVVPQPSVVMLGEVLHQAAAELAPRAQAKGLSLRVGRSDLAAMSDPALLLRILRNLGENAVRYTDHGGVLLACRRRGDTVRLEVWDTGRGIPEICRDLVFEEFFQVGNPERDRRQGLGLGLSIVQRLARLLGHSVELQSRPGRGTVFAVVMPAAVVEAQPEELRAMTLP